MVEAGIPKPQLRRQCNDRCKSLSVSQSHILSHGRQGDHEVIVKAILLSTGHYRSLDSKSYGPTQHRKEKRKTKGKMLFFGVVICWILGNNLLLLFEVKSGNTKSVKIKPVNLMTCSWLNIDWPLLLHFKSTQSDTVAPPSFAFVWNKQKSIATLCLPPLFFYLYFIHFYFSCLNGDIADDTSQISHKKIYSQSCSGLWCSWDLKYKRSMHQDPP